VSLSPSISLSSKQVLTRGESKDIFITNQAYKFKIPSSLAPGNYIVRHELIALHSGISLHLPL
jgi:Auxiliary Activity family 9 (formerly GH61)